MNERLREPGADTLAGKLVHVSNKPPSYTMQLNSCFCLLIITFVSAVIRPIFCSAVDRAVLIRCCDAPNGSGTAANTFRPSPTCSLRRRRLFSPCPKPRTNSNHVFQLYLSYKTDMPYQLHNSKIN